MNNFKIWKIFKKIKRFLFVNYVSITFKKKIKRKIKNDKSKSLSKKQIEEISRYYKSLGVKKMKPYWHQYFSDINGYFSTKYIPQDYFYSTISFALNQKAYRCLMDKNLLDKLFIGIKHPNAAIKKINGFYFHKDKVVNKAEAIKVCNRYNKLLIKPTIYSGGGDSISIFSLKNGDTDFQNLTLNELFAKYGQNFIVQEVVVQHERLKLLNESSLNTLRIISYMPNENVHILSTYIRIGNKGSIVDNISSGGIGCRVNPDGVLSKIGYYYDFKNQTLKTENGTLLEGFTIPCYKEILEKIEILHKQVPYFKIVAWDISVDENENIVLIEYNLWEQGIDFTQVVNGPLFGEFTDEVLKRAVDFDKRH